MTVSLNTHRNEASLTQLSRVLSEFIAAVELERYNPWPKAAFQKCH